MNADVTKPVPDLDDPEMSPFWRATRRHELTAQKCTSCGALRFPALPICPSCLERGSEWVPVSSLGTVWSFAIYHRAFHPGFKDDVPYVVAIVENEDGLHYPGNIVGRRDRLSVGAPVHVVFEDVSEGFTLPKWELSS
jgi:uncharacterized protein